nr:NAD-dependent epimerase/dehydratase family protein [Clostridia bacterium]
MRLKWTEEKLNEMLCTPSDALVADIAKIEGDILVLGASGKMGPTLCMLAKNAIDKAGIAKKVYAVARFSDKESEKLLRDNGVETITCDLSNTQQLAALPDCKNIIYMAGRKFGTDGNEWQTWGMNSLVPAFVVDRFRDANYVVFSSGNIYPKTNISLGGCSEKMPTGPIGEYAESCLARERTFEYGANTFGAKVFMYRLNYAVDLRYGVIYDIAKKIMEGTPISLSMPTFNCVWQGYANEVAIRGLLHCENPVNIMNVTGPETVSVKKTALTLASMLGKEAIIVDEPSDTALLSDSAKCMETFGYPTVSVNTLIKWQAEWIIDGGRALGKPTHFEERNGKF